MDAMDILGGLLGGKKSSGGSLGGKILKDLMGGGRSSAPSPRGGGAEPLPDRNRRSGSIAGQAQELEDLLGVATGRTQRSSPPSRTSSSRTTSSRSAPRREPPNFRDVGSRYQQPPASPSQRRTVPPRSQQPTVSEDQETIVLIRAMINAAKADGQITDDEQKEILSRVSDRSQQTIQFLRDEFAKPVDVREFAWSVPIGLEEKVYMMSLAAIDFDSTREAAYLSDLAHGLRLAEPEVDEIHRQLGAPVFR
ncbi:MAG: hypothetical protein Aurels2KO_01940 [Aureliella sp.]